MKKGMFIVLGIILFAAAFSLSLYSHAEKEDLKPSPGAVPVAKISVQAGELRALVKELDLKKASDNEQVEVKVNTKTGKIVKKVDGAVMFLEITASDVEEGVLRESIPCCCSEGSNCKCSAEECDDCSGSC